MTKANSAVAQEMVRRRVEKQFWKFLDQTSRIADQLTDLMYGDQSLSSAEHIAVADALNEMLKARAQVMKASARMKAHAHKEAAQ